MWSDYFLFLLKTVTFVFAFVVVVGAIIRASKGTVETPGQGKLVVSDLNKALESIRTRMQSQLLSKKALKKIQKEKKAEAKLKKGSTEESETAFAIRFKGDIQASQVNQLRQEVTAILAIAKPGDEVVVSIESPGGAVSGYGLAASQLQRLVDAELKLTACVDKVAASGGYMMACVADKIYAAPFAIVGSIGVVSQIPNIHRLLKRLDIDVDVLTAGKHKAPMTLLGENTDEGRAKHKQDLTAIHNRFKSLVGSHRSELDIDGVSEGDFWLAEDALELKLVDGIKTSDDYLQDLCKTANVYRVQWVPHQSIEQRLKGASNALFASLENAVFKRWLP